MLAQAEQKACYRGLFLYPCIKLFHLLSLKTFRIFIFVLKYLFPLFAAHVWVPCTTESQRVTFHIQSERTWDFLISLFLLGLALLFLCV